MKFFALLLIIPFAGCGQTSYTTRELKAGSFKEDSSYAYSLPFEENKRVFVVQGYESMFSHKGERALDFKVKKGTRICAARDGVVVGARDDSNKGGLKPSNISDGNYVSIKHDDGSVANYWHLKQGAVFVKIGDPVSEGQVIGLSGNTGYSAFPHLHFEVIGNDENGEYRQLATRFRTKKGSIYLRPGRFYKAVRYR